MLKSKEVFHDEAYKRKVLLKEDPGDSVHGGLYDEDPEDSVHGGLYDEDLEDSVYGCLYDEDQ